MSNKYLKPMLDNGSPRVFNCNEMTQKIIAANPEGEPELFFKNKPLNNIVLIKDTVPETERANKLAPSVGTKLYFPFNETNIYEGGRTIFLHDKQVEAAICERFGEGAIDKDALASDLRIMTIMNRLPSLDPFLLKDVFIRQKIPVNNTYFDVSEETWNQIETFMLQRFEPLVRAAFPDTDSSDDKARQLIDKIWEARDLEALQPLITAFRLPQVEALDIFSSWRGIVYYSYQYQRQQPAMIELIKWLAANEAPVAGVTAAETKEMATLMASIKTQLRKEWQTTETIVKDYEDSYNKMFRDKISSTEFLNFLRNSNKTYWEIGNSLGKITHATYCWDVLTSRHKERKLPWVQLQSTARLLASVFAPEKKATTNMTW